MRKIFKKLHVIFLSFVLTFAPAYVMAATSSGLGGWSITNTIQQGATSILTGTKDLVLNGKNYIKTGTAKITPTASQVAKQIVKTGAVGAVALAIDLLLDGADYVMDPANNRVIYYDKPNSSNSEYIYTSIEFPTLGQFYTAVDACKAYVTYRSSLNPDVSYAFVFATSASGDYDGFSKCTYKPSNEGSNYSSNLYYVRNNAQVEERQEKYLPYTTVGQQIIDDANSGRTDVAPPYIGGVASDLAASDAATQSNIQSQLESSAQTKPADAAEAESANEATGNSKPNTANPDVTDISLEFPVFCSWAPSVCEAAQVVISFPARVQTWVTDLLGQGQRIEEQEKATTEQATKTAEATEAIRDTLTKEDDLPERDNTDILLPDVPITPQTVNVNWGKSCPAPTTVNISFGGQSKEITIMNYEFICEWAWVVEYSVIALAAISSVFIVAGRKS